MERRPRSSQGDNPIGNHATASCNSVPNLFLSKLLVQVPDPLASANEYRCTASVAIQKARMEASQKPKRHPSVIRAWQARHARLRNRPAAQRVEEIRNLRLSKG